MAAQYTKKFVARRFELFCEDMGLSTKCWTRDPETGLNVATVGAVYLDHAACYGGYQINRMENQGGGVSILTGYCNRMSGRELDQWMQGALWAKDHKPA